GVEIHLNTFVNSYEDNIVKTNNEDLSFNTETFIWSAGVTGAAIEGLKTGALMEKANRYNVNAFNQIDGYENIFAIGDIALMTSEDYPKGHPMVAQP
ncbi:FAD-dependent oxidoreductase, partial [Aquimarina celericrescens]|nr:FAD-dependent oxidoreductase [Aquimarina celericrescens]